MQCQRRLHISWVKNIGSAFVLSGGVAFRQASPYGELLVFIFSETTSLRTINFKIYHHEVFHSLYISAGNNVAIYFRSEVNRAHMSILSHSLSRFLNNGKTVFESVYSFAKGESGASFPIVKTSTCLLLDPDKLAQNRPPVLRASCKWLIFRQNAFRRFALMWWPAYGVT